MKLTVYTAIFGDYDVLKEPLYTNKNIKYICFSDRKYKSKVWDVRVIERTEPTPRRDARKIKVLSHKYIDTPISIWIDGGRMITKNPEPYVKEALKKAVFLAGVHGKRNCIYDEAIRCIKAKKGDKLLIAEQVVRYIEEGYPENNGMINSTVLIRRITPELIQVENDWWYEIKNGCCRDQISFNYVAWKNNFKYSFVKWREFVGAGKHK